MNRQKMKVKVKKYSFLLFLILCYPGFSQNYQGTVNKVSNNGLYNLKLTSELRSATKENFNFIRIKNSKNEEVPYVVIYPKNKSLAEFKKIDIYKKISIKDSVTSIIVENTTEEILDAITLQIANTEISKTYTIFGSNDGVNFFGLLANKTLTNLSSKSKTSIEKTIFFPVNSYKFLKIDFNDKNSLPIEILAVGNYINKFFTQNPIELSNFNMDIITINDRKVTQLVFKANAAYKIDAISFIINTEYFKRTAKVILKKTRELKKRIETYEHVITTFEINSNHQNTVGLYNLNDKEFIIEIENQDNPPLNISSIKLYQKPIYLVANLKQNENYSFIIDSTLNKPSYDLGNFIFDKKKTLKEVSVSDFSKVKVRLSENDTSFWETSSFMWICIVAGGVLVVYFAIVLLKDINNQKKV